MINKNTRQYSLMAVFTINRSSVNVFISKNLPIKTKVGIFKLLKFKYLTNFLPYDRLRKITDFFHLVD